MERHEIVRPKIELARPHEPSIASFAEVRCLGCGESLFPQPDLVSVKEDFGPGPLWFDSAWDEAVCLATPEQEASANDPDAPPIWHRPTLVFANVYQTPREEQHA